MLIEASSIWAHSLEGEVLLGGKDMGSLWPWDEFLHPKSRN